VQAGRRPNAGRGIMSLRGANAAFRGSRYRVGEDRATEMVIADTIGVVSAFTAIAAVAVTAFGYVGYQNRRERLAAIRKALDEVVGSLASEDEERRLAGAILLRRFFDAKSEFGLRTLVPPRRRAPYADESLSVIAAVLRGLETSNFQKLLADGLAYSPGLRLADLQKTNLQNAYLGTRYKGVSLDRADFYRSDLSGASLKGCSA
jgi:Pentapeptide repeats (8 copies)